jgi:hypothetical protein
MYEIPDFNNKQIMFDAGVNWSLLAPNNRVGRMIAHYEVMKMIQEVPGEIIECGVFKGESLTRLAQFRKILGTDDNSKIIGFDNFNDEYPNTSYDEDQPQRKHWIETAGSSSIKVEQLTKVFDFHNFTNYEFIAGDICKTVPDYFKKNPGIKVSLLNIDCDFVEPTYTALKTIWPHMSEGGVVLLDNYGGWGTSGCSYFGDTKGADDFFKEIDNKPILKKFNWVSRPCYFIKK